MVNMVDINICLNMVDINLYVNYINVDTLHEVLTKVWDSTVPTFFYNLTKHKICIVHNTFICYPYKFG